MSPVAETALETEILDLCIRIAHFVGLPKSVGEIYGTLLVSPKPLCLDAIMAKSGASKGSVSQGLRQLKELGAVRPQAAPNERREHYVAETGLGHLVEGFLRQRIEPGIGDLGSRLEVLHGKGVRGEDLEDERAKFLMQRLSKMKSWQEQAALMLPVAKQALVG
jgi:DNA-binding transcriptional regulator GbsR (MarR family)